MGSHNGVVGDEENPHNGIRIQPVFSTPMQVFFFFFLFFVIFLQFLYCKCKFLIMVLEILLQEGAVEK